MPTRSAVERILRGAGVLGATDARSGFVVFQIDDVTVDVRWSAPPGRDVSGLGLSDLEYCARVLRENGIGATLVADADEPRVRCLSRRRETRRASRTT